MKNELDPLFPETVSQQWGGGNIKILQRFNTDKQESEEMVDVLGVKLKRRNPSTAKLPGSNLKPERFSDLSFSASDILYLQAALMRHKMGHHVLFLGPPGLGKSRMTEFIAYLLNIPFYRVGCQKGMNVAKSFLWTMVPKETGGWEGRLGPLPLSMRDGGIILVDELANLEPAERQVLLEPTERPNNRDVSPAAPTLSIPDFPGQVVRIEAAEGWLIIATGNYSEGQGTGEVYPLSDREVRRARYHMLPPIGEGVRRRRAVGRWFSGEMKEETISLPRSHYYEEDEEKVMTVEVGEVISQLFEQFDKKATEALKGLRQDPPVYTTEALERAFDHFMLFQMKQAANGRNMLDRRTDEVVETAKAAIEFCFINGFREETLVSVPDTEQAAYKSENNPMTDTGRASAKLYLRWKLNNLIRDLKYKVKQAGGVETEVSFKTRLKAALQEGVKVHESGEVIRKLVDLQFPMAGMLAKDLAPAGTPVPTSDQVKKALGKMNSTEVKDYLAMKRPILIVEPSIDPVKLRDYYDTKFPKKRGNSQELNAVWDGSVNLSDIVTFEAVIVEGDNTAPDLPGDNPSKTLQERLALSPTLPMTMNTYHLLEMRSMQQAGMVDKDSTRTILAGTTATGKVGLGKWTTWLHAEMKNTGVIEPSARFRKQIRKPIQ